MKKLISLLLVMLSVSPAYADRDYGGDHGHGGGRGWSGGWVFPALIGGAIIYGLSQPKPVVQPQAVYIQPAPAYAPATQQYWYFCTAANAYYPYVATCPSGWLPVLATPPAVPAGAPYAPLAR